MARYLKDFIIKDLERKMVFLGGPRQVGKTTLCNIISKHFHPSAYLNWDIDENKSMIRQKKWSREATLVTFDELHKYARWKQWIKGVYDSKIEHQRYLVTGSAKLDVYKRDGDSLLGRYHYWRLHPFTLDELPESINTNEAYERLLTVGGFPEPFIQNDIREARRWRAERFSRILKEDVRELTHIHEISLLDMLIEALRERVSGLIVYANLAEDLLLSPHTIKNWISLIERMYIGFTITPYTKNIFRSIQKPKKMYFYDNADCVEDRAIRLENLVATHLLKRLHFIEDYFGYRCALHYIRDRDEREVDFVTVIDKKVMELIEVKWSDEKPSSALKYYQEKLSPKKTIQIVGNIKNSYLHKDILVTSPIHYFKSPPWETFLDPIKESS